MRRSCQSLALVTIRCCHSNVVFRSGRLVVTLSTLVKPWLSPTVAAAVAIGLAAPAPTLAQTTADAVSAYSSTAPQDCRSERARKHPVPEDGGTRVCPGLHGFVVVVSENDLRETVSIGRNRALADKEPAARKSFGPFNSAATTVEWRSRRNRPFAVIQRWYLADINDPDKNNRPRNKQ